VTTPYTLFEVSWEVCNKVGGIHTVVSSKAKTLVERLGDNYVTIGPWLMGEEGTDPPFEDVYGHEDFIDACRAAGVPVRVGRWLIPGRPLTILVAFSSFYEQKDGILAGLWERFGVDSLSGQWDYIEPVLFGHATGIAIQTWWQTAPRAPDQCAVAQFHEWLTGAGLLFLKENEPGVGTVFTTHATVLGRAIASTGVLPIDALAQQTPDELAVELRVSAKHSLEGVTGRAADVFTTVSEITATEAERLHGRRPAPILPNGIDMAVIDAAVGGVTRERAEATVRALASRFLGEDAGDAALICISGRYEFHNKGIDILLEAAAALDRVLGRPVVLLVLSPAGNSGIRGGLLDRLAKPVADCEPLGIATHNLFDPTHDPVQLHCAELGLDNHPGKRVKVIQIPIYLRPGDGLLDLPYEAVIQAMDLTCFPSFYEPWGYTPLESLALGVPTVTSDGAGFGQWCLSHGLGPGDGVHVLTRLGVARDKAVALLAESIESALTAPPERAHVAARCRAAAERTSWSELIANYETAIAEAAQMAATRAERRAPALFPSAVTVPLRPMAERQRPRLVSFDVFATLPESLHDLLHLSRNYWWTWGPEAESLFAELAPARWEACGHNPLLLLRQASAEELATAAANPEYVARLQRVVARFDGYMAVVDQAATEGGPALPHPRHPVAYFCAEFGLHESLPIYGGGLGILAGDHLKAASDLGLPLVAVGLFYRMGYVSQWLTASGEQVARDVVVNPADQPLTLVHDETGEPLEIVLPMPGGTVALRAWRVEIGRVPLYLLDTDVPRNRPEDRDITRNLYGGGAEMRLRQEIVLGKGGVRLLQRLGIEPSVFHLNEGHAALVPLERVSHLVRQQGLKFEEAREFVRATTVFTTHTPVPAGHDKFGEDLMRPYFADVPDWIGLPWERFFALGQAPDESGVFNMTGLALNLAGFCNAVSKLHQRVTQRLLHPFWPGHLENEVPIQAITNGVHLASWCHPDVAHLVGAIDRPVSFREFAANSIGIADDALWAARRQARQRLRIEVKERLERRFIERHDTPRLLNEMIEGLEEDSLLIGFARRFAPYKRAHLLFQDLERLSAILSQSARPVRVLFAGTAHPNDGRGQEILRSVFELSRSTDLVGRVYFVEGYDIELARLLVQGCDVWLNTPIHGLEASGTSGMKAAANGALNLSILDGWWSEAYDGRNGWAIGGERVYEQQPLQDELDGAELYRLLEDEVVPLYFGRDGQGVPRRWLAQVKRSLATIPAVFGTLRMVREYAEQAYAPMATDIPRLAAERYAEVRRTARLVEAHRVAFPEIEILKADIARPGGRDAGRPIQARVEVQLGTLLPDDVLVELVVGGADGVDRLGGMTAVPLQPVDWAPGPVWTFEGTHTVTQAGMYAYGVRVRPCCDGMSDPWLSDLVVWA
jgi:glycogen phosphorylase/synthase